MTDCQTFFLWLAFGPALVLLVCLLADRVLGRPVREVAP